MTPATHNPSLAAPAFSAEVLAAARRVSERCPGAEPLLHLPDVHPGRLPRHIAIIMDGNGRWAAERGMPRNFGHAQGSEVAKDLVAHCSKLGVEVITLYSFSVENWKRPRDEVDALMELCIAYCKSQREHLLANNIRFRMVGRREGLPQGVLDAIDELTAATAHCPGTTFCLAINYGGRSELVDAMRGIARDVAAGTLAASEIDEASISRRLYTGGLPDPDLLIRTAGEMRVSNFLLWQISYAELYVTDVLWPDFGPERLHEAIRAYAGRSRRFGGLDGV
ncbi:MAG: isoprenyl transferase [Planctomycetota bacterium]|nr:isoprenyl transferase [Planctomycetota bacterium]